MSQHEGTEGQAKRTFNLRAEAVACIWEAMLSRPDANMGRERQRDAMLRAWADYGTPTMRHKAIYFADTMLDVYDLMGEADLLDRDLLPYDWEFAPAFVHLIPDNYWSGDDALPSAADMADFIRAKYPKKDT